MIERQYIKEKTELKLWYLSLREGLPIVIFLTDQTFPPVLPPTGDGNCTVIIRVEDSELWELEEVFYDRFKSFCKPHGSLPSGSLVLVGSMSHLAKNGRQGGAWRKRNSLCSGPDRRYRFGDTGPGHDGPG
jgi:hypothetical protein